MAITATPCHVASRDLLGDQLDDSVTVADGNISPDLPEGFYRIKATSACTVRIGNGIANASGGEPWSSGEKETRFIRNGFNIAVDAAS